MAFAAPYAQLKVDKKNRIALEEQLKEIGITQITAGIHKNDGHEIIDSKRGIKLIDIAVQNEYGNEWVEPKTVNFPKDKYSKDTEWFHIKKSTVIRIPATHFVSKLINDMRYRATVVTEIQTDIHMMLAPYNGYGGTKKYTASAVARDIGKHCEEMIKWFIDSKQFEPNAPMTIERKGFDKRLYDKGKLYNAIKYKFRKAKK